MGGLLTGMMFARRHFLFGLSCLLLFVEARATIILFGNETISYPSMDASFTPAIPDAGILGDVYVPESLHGCSPFAFTITSTAFAVVERGECTFEQKVRNAQDAGFAAVIVFNNANNAKLVSMAGSSAGISTYALYVSREAGEMLKSLEGFAYILPGYKQKTWAIKWLVLSVSLIVVVIVGALVTALCCIRQHILAEAEKEAYNEKLLHDDEYILNREFIPDAFGTEGLGGEDAVTVSDGVNSENLLGEGAAWDSDHPSDSSTNNVPK